MIKKIDELSNFGIYEFVANTFDFIPTFNNS
jgi:hypothetical protein